MKIIGGIVFVLLFPFLVVAQDDIPTKKPERSGELDLNNYFFKDDYIFMPVVKGQIGQFHLEGRYNYEDRQTASFWLGYHFTGGKKLEFDICPMFAGVAGNTSGFAPGLEITLSWKNFEFYSESEHLFDPAETENNFFYNWTDLTYTIKERYWFGLTAQRTRLFQTDVELDRGLLAGITYRSFDAGLAFYNLDRDEPFILLMFNVSF